MEIINFISGYLIDTIGKYYKDPLKLASLGIIKKEEDVYAFTSKALYIAYKEKIITKLFIRSLFRYVVSADTFVWHGLWPRQIEFLYDPEYNVRLINEDIVLYHVIYNKHHKLGRTDLEYFGGIEGILSSRGVLSGKIEPMNLRPAYNPNFYSLAVHTDFLYTELEMRKIIGFIRMFSTDYLAGRDVYILITLKSIRQYCKRSRVYRNYDV